MFAGLFVSVFVGALAYRLIKRTGIDEVTDSEGFQSEPQTVYEEHMRAGRLSPESP